MRARMGSESGVRVTTLTPDSALDTSDSGTKRPSKQALWQEGTDGPACDKPAQFARA